MELKIKIGKKTIVTAIILCVVAVIYNVVYFAVPWERSNSVGAFWISYAFTWISLLSAGIIVSVVVNKNELKSRVFGIPVLYVGFFLVVIQLIFDLIIMSVSFATSVPFWISLVFEVVLFGIAIIATTVRTVYRQTIDDIDNKQTSNKEFIKELRIKVNSLLDSNPLDEIQCELETLVENIKYSDPVSSKDVEEVENTILTEFEKLENSIQEKNVNDSLKQLNKIEALLKERKNRNHK